jgi:hypothetical protein
MTRSTKLWKLVCKHNCGGISIIFRYATNILGTFLRNIFVGCFSNLGMQCQVRSKFIWKLTGGVTSRTRFVMRGLISYLSRRNRTQPTGPQTQCIVILDFHFTLITVYLLNSLVWIEYQTNLSSPFFIT